jgi:hypothetical protein
VYILAREASVHTSTRGAVSVPTSVPTSTRGVPLTVATT